MATRGDAMKLKCPYCQAEAGKRCRGKRGLRLALHRERYQAASIIGYVKNGFMSARRAAVLLDCTVDDVSEAAFGEVVL